jgi:glycyl-tRNA synthetase alpha chain
LAQSVQGVDSVYDIDWNGAEGPLRKTYGDVFLRNEREFSAFNFEYARTDMLWLGSCFVMMQSK